MSSRGGGSSRGASRARAALVVGQLVMATVLLVGAGLLIRSFASFGGRPWLRPRQRACLPAGVPRRLLRHAEDRHHRSTFGAAPRCSRRRGRGLHPGGDAHRRANHRWHVRAAGRTLEEMRAYAVAFSSARERRLLTAVGARVLEGRELTPADSDAATPAIVISRSVARLFGQGSQVGRLVDWHWARGQPSRCGSSASSRIYATLRPTASPIPKSSSTIGGCWRFSSNGAIGAAAERARARPAVVCRSARSGRGAAIPAVSQIVRAVDANAGIDAIVPHGSAGGELGRAATLLCGDAWRLRGRRRLSVGRSASTACSPMP